MEKEQDASFPEREDQSISKFNPSSSQIPKEYQAMIRQIGDLCGHKIQMYLKQYLRFNVEVHWEGMENTIFRKFILSLPEQCCIHILQSPAFHQYSMFVQNTDTVTALMERVMGAHTLNNSTMIEYTNIETVVISRISLMVLREIESSFQHLVDINWKIERQESNPMLASIIPDKENVVVLRFSVGGELPQGKICLCITSKDILRYLEKYKKSQGSKKKTVNNKVFRHLQQVPITVSVRLGEIQLSYKELMELAPGDILRMNRPLSSSAFIYIENHRKYLAKIGRVKQNWGCIVEKTIGGKYV